jgi:hypothetical protein
MNEEEMSGEKAGSSVQVSTMSRMEKAGSSVRVSTMSRISRMLTGGPARSTDFLEAVSHLQHLQISHLYDNVTANIHLSAA